MSSHFAIVGEVGRGGVRAHFFFIFFFYFLFARRCVLAGPHHVISNKLLKSKIDSKFRDLDILRHPGSAAGEGGARKRLCSLYVFGLRAMLGWLPSRDFL